MHTTWKVPFGILALAASLGALAPADSRAAEIALPGGVKVAQVDFERHLMGVFGRMGCNLGSCHGSFQGKGGFQLSLFGYAPDKDYLALTRDLQGRRINLADPDSSLLLLKATGQVPHEGQLRFARGSWAYQLFREWVRQGAVWTPGSGEVTAIAITPPEYVFKKPGETGQLQVHATFKDGTRENITPFCDFRVNDDAIAEVSRDGQVTGIRPGDTAVIVSYRGHVLPVRVMVPNELPKGTVYPAVPEGTFIDREVFAKLRRLNIIPSGLSSDTEFLRRVTIDTIGTLPTPEEVRAFLADDRPDKRERKIDELLKHPMHAALWATKLSDVTGNNTDEMENPANMRVKHSQMWHDWLRKRIHENMPYDELVHGILCATSREGDAPEKWVKETATIYEQAARGFKTGYEERRTLDLFWRKRQRVPIEIWGEKTAAAFMGIRLECAQCHKHPFDRWTQEEYRAYANIFAGLNSGTSPEARKALTDFNDSQRKGKRANQALQLRELYVASPRGLLPDPGTGKSLTPKALGGPEIEVAGSDDPREALFRWLRSPDNPFFARSFVNRVWGHYFGRGIVDPVDDFSLANPPSNDRLLDALAREFVNSKYDIRKIEKAILMSRTYQLSAATNETNAQDRTNYSHSYIRPLLAEVVVDVLDAGLGTQESFGNDAPPGARAIEVGASRLTNQTVGYVFRIFGRPPRTTACDCERAMEPGLPQKLYLMADPNIESKLTGRGNNRIRQLLAKYKTDDEAALEELFLATVTRPPTAQEKALFAQHRAGQPDREIAFRDALWAVINTTEFIFNH